MSFCFLGSNEGIVLIRLVGMLVVLCVGNLHISISPKIFLFFFMLCCFFFHFLPFSSIGGRKDEFFFKVSDEMKKLRVWFEVRIFGCVGVCGGLFFLAAFFLCA